MAVESAVVSLNNIRYRVGDRVLLQEASVSIHVGERLGFIGRNGTGKSTCCRLIAGLETPDSGEVVLRRNLIIGYLPQNFDLDLEKNIFENIRSGAGHVLSLISQFEKLPGDSAQAHELEHQIAHFQGWTLDQRIKEVMSHLNTPPGERSVTELSGGEKRRVALARTLVARPDFLILDEPTNHLDPEAIEWLAEFLKEYDGTVLLVTHDRYFLDEVTTRIAEIANQTFYSYAGNYTDYLLAKAEREQSEARNEQSRQNFLRKELDWVRRGPKARTTKSKSRLDRYFDIAGQAPPEEELDVDLVIPPAPPLGNRGVELLDVGATVGGRSLFSGLSLNLEPGVKIGVAGKNGLGKSTLLKIILGEIQPSEGTVRIGEQTIFNYVDQHRLQIDESKTVLDEVGQGSEVVRLGEKTISLRSYLRRFLFSDERINTEIRYLSGGERSRVLLARILKRGGNFLIFDEPTNDLDLPTLRVLEEALAGFKGSVLVVSHDRYFLNRVCDRMLVFEGDGIVKSSVGNYDYYLEKKHRDSGTTTAAPVSRETSDRTPAKPKKIKWKETQELASMENTIHDAEREVAKLEAMFASPDFYKLRAEHRSLEIELASAREKVQNLYARWEELEALANAAG